MSLPKVKPCECGKMPEVTTVVHTRVDCVCGNYVECNYSAREAIFQWNREDYSRGSWNETKTDSTQKD